MCKVLNARQVGKGPVLDRVYVGRPSKWGNPFVIGRDSSRDEVIAKYRAWIVRQPALMAALPELRGKICHKWETGGLTPPYDYVNELKPPELAWEFLRRNPDYRRNYRTAVEAAADETGISQAPCDGVCDAGK